MLCIVGTWLYEDINDSELLLPGYQLYRLDCSRHGGGIMMYVCSSPPTTFRPVWMYYNADFFQASDIIRQIDWDSLLLDDLDHSTELWTKNFFVIMKECIPHRDLSLKRRNLPWITKNIIRYMQK